MPCLMLLLPRFCPSFRVEAVIVTEPGLIMPFETKGFRGALAVLAGALALTSAGFAGAQTAPATAVQAPLTAAAPDVIPDVIDQVMDAVVLISTSQNLPGDPQNDTAAPEGEGAEPTPDATPPEAGSDGPQAAPDAPLDEFFEDFFDRQQRGEGRTRPTGEGSGFVIDAEGTIITNFHVVDGADRIEVVFNDGTKLAAQVLGRDRETDLAVLKVDATRPLKFVQFGDSEQLRVGEGVLAMGNPFGIGLSATSGIVSGRNRDMRTGRYDNFIQTDASINKGNSGGPLFNLSGQVVGVNTAILSPTGGSVGIGFAVPASTVQPVVRQLIEFGETRRGYIGVRIQDVPEEMVKRLGLTGVQGALIAGVVENGPAAQAGLQIGDVLVSFDGRPVTTSRALQRIVADVAMDREVEAVIWRDGKQVTVTIKVGRLEDSDTAAAGSEPDAEAPTAEEPPKATGQALGLDLAPLDAETRNRFKIEEGVDAGVVIIAVGPQSPLKDQKISVGDVMVEIAQQRVANPEELNARLDELRKSGQTSALALIASPDGELRFLRVPLE